MLNIRKMRYYKLLTLILVLTYCVSYGQNEKTSNLVQTDSIFFGNCETGIEKAIIDFKDHKYSCYSYGLVIYLNPDFSEFYQNYMKKKYNINLANKGCLITDYSDCYSQTMDKLVYGKFGEDIFERTRKKAREIFDKTH